jgi:hypothetical protein
MTPAGLRVLVVGPFATVPEAVAAARRIPFLSLSGYGQSAIPDDRPEWRVCSKPFREGDLIAMLTEQLTQTPDRRLR